MRKPCPQDHPQQAGMSLQKKTVHTTERERSDVITKREEWPNVQSKIVLKKLFFLDERSVNTNMLILYDRAKCGQRANNAILPEYGCIHQTPVSRVSYFHRLHPAK